MKIRKLSLLVFGGFILMSLSCFPGCTKKSGDAVPSADNSKRKVVIGIIAKSLTNDVFQAAQTGAQNAAKELGEKYGVEVELEIRTPNDEDATKQAEAVEALTRAGVDGIAIKSVEMLLDKILKGQNPPQERVIDPLTKVTKENVDEYARNWEKWLKK